MKSIWTKKNTSPVYQIFINGLKKAEVHRNPLFIIALAIYTYENSGEGISEVQIFDIERGKLISYLTSREIRLIQNEVEEYNQRPYHNETIDYEAVLLIQSIANTASGINEEKLEILKSRLGNKAAFPLPEIKHLSRLSLWQNGEISPLEPDVLAADFSRFCVEKWGGVEKGAWMIMPVRKQTLNEGHCDE